MLQRGFMSGVKVRFLHREEILSRILPAAEKLLTLNPNVLEINLFGSLAKGNHAPGSDADIYILLKEDSRRFTDRIPEFLDDFSKMGIPVEVFPYTREEIAKMRDRGFIKTMLKEKVVLASRASSKNNQQSS